MQTTQVNASLLGNEISKHIYSEHGTMLIKKGTIINNDVLSKLLSHNVDVVYVLNALKKDIKEETLLSEPEMQKSVASIKKVFDDVMYQEKQGIKAVIPIENLKLVEEVLELLIETLEKADQILYTVVDLLQSDGYTYKHNVNVAILSILTSKALGYKKEDIKHIALGALLHDIGKMKVSPMLINKPSSLTLEERIEVEKHAQFGYEITETVSQIPFLSKQIIRLHHEKLDGSGYPLGLKGIEIPEYVKIVTVCDMYDAMTTNRIYRSKMPIYKALEILMTESVFKIDPKIYRTLTNNICIFPPGSGVVLSDGRIGVVTHFRHASPSRPSVKVLNLNDKNSFLDVEEINLEYNRTLFIVDTWDIDLFHQISKNATD
ncbi:HD-GYP domain-containing protein [Fusibacter ferrireducens]|uniref:HD-GYP domain-containing protein n=1 Tax=Fusibacter ferrireducens TaxID=2785058 RepID=A0ABR9ZTT2_9FIRM|nr:HD-GYP domain-containing protein [Fusibacter ferrireducens]MBF4693558.1 HD-GYP domain-containing protein [Fusibacter ferrireducens]